MVKLIDCPVVMRDGLPFLKCTQAGWDKLAEEPGGELFALILDEERVLGFENDEEGEVVLSVYFDMVGAVSALIPCTEALIQMGIPSRRLKAQRLQRIDP